MIKQITAKCCCIIFILLVVGCSNEDKQSSIQKTTETKELLIYCGITMIKPMTEIATHLEQKNNYKFIITKGGSGNLLKSIIHNKTGDLYLPGSDRYYSIINENHPGLITKTVAVGHNKAVMMVQKGNPNNISSDLSNLANKEYGVIIGNPDSGSIGKETRKLLIKKGIYSDVVNNVMSLTTDSKDLVKSLVNKQADLVINWFAASTWDDNPKYIDVIEIDPEYAKVKKLELGLLKYSKHPEVAAEFLQFAASEKGKNIFKKYGLYFE